MEVVQYTRKHWLHTLLMVIDESTQCEKLPRTQCKRKVLLHMWSNSAGVFSRNDKNTLKYTGAQEMTRSCCFAARLEVSQRTSVKKLKNTQDAKHHFRKAVERNFEGCAGRWNEDAVHARKTAAREQTG